MALCVDNQGAPLGRANQGHADRLIYRVLPGCQQNSASKATATTERLGLVDHEHALLIEGIVVQSHAKERTIEQNRKDACTSNGEDQTPTQSAGPAAWLLEVQACHAG